MVIYVKHDLEFILNQILLSEQHATREDPLTGAPVAGTPLAELITNPLLPAGLRTVAGSYNNIIPGRENFGAADQPFPRLTDPFFRPAEDLSFDPDGPGPQAAGSSTNYGQTSGFVQDSQPRTISNLIVDQTPNNPAAVLAALKYAGIEGSAATAPAAAIAAANEALKAAKAAAGGGLDAIEDAEDAVAAATSAQANAAAANTAAQATVTAYSSAAAASNLADDAGLTAALATNNLLTALAADPNVDPVDLTLVNTAVTTVTAFATGAGNVLAALQTGPNVTPADLAAAQSLAANTDALLATITALQTALNADPTVDPLDLAAAISSATNALTSFLAANNLTTQLGTSLAAATADAASAASALASADAALAAAQDALADVIAANADAVAAVTAAEQALADTLVANGVEMTENGSLVIPNIAPDEGVSAPFNSWMTLFGQFFDHGLDLVSKGGSGTVFIPLSPDDPLYDPASPTNFMVLTRATNQPGPDGILGTGDDIHEHTNTTTPFVDQNQTYTSHPSHQVFLREYQLDADGDVVATGNLHEEQNGGLTTWADVKAQAAEMLGIRLVDADVVNVPLLATDEYGRFLRGPNGHAQVVVNTPTGQVLVEADPGANGGLGLTLAEIGALGGGVVVRTGHAFLDDIAHSANPIGDHDGNPGTPSAPLAADADTVTGGGLDPVALGTYDNELLDRHFITGDGRGNENIGLSAVHHVFHSEHNRLADHTKVVLLNLDVRDGVAQEGDLTISGLELLNGFLIPGEELTQAQLEAIAADFAASGIDRADTEAVNAFIDGLGLEWNGERLFQAARFGTEMQYQHLVFEEFARKVQPAVDLFVFNPTMDIDPAIFAEFAHVVYRFGHSMLNETVDRLSADGTTSSDIGLIEAFLNPVSFHQLTDAGGNTIEVSSDEAAGAIVRGMTRQHGNEIDEFVTDALRNNLLGLPLDLAAINMTRARDTGVPTLNAARAQFFEETQSEWLKPYTNWVEFAQHLKNPASVINFIAAYGTHESITSETTIEGKRDAATLLVLGGAGAPADRLQFLNGTGAWANNAGHELDYDGVTTTGLGNIDLWIGGLAEEILPFGGMLGSTFTFVFEKQMENLQNGDRFYYLSRVQGLHFLTELENNAFSKLVKLNTDLGADGATHLPGELFANPDHILEVNQAVQLEADPLHDDPILAALEPKVFRASNVTLDGHVYDNELKFEGEEHVVLGGTNDDDILRGDLGDDTLWGDGGNDYLVGGHGVNRLHGGTGDDIIFDGGDISFIHGDEGNDAINGGAGLGELIFAGDGSDFVIAGIDGKEVFGGLGNDFIFGSPDLDFLLGGEGDDWIEGGEGFDTLAGDNSELFFNSTIIGHDVLFAGANENDFDAESGDDIMVQGESVMRNEGMLGFDWAIFKDSDVAADADMRIPIFTTVEADILRNRFDHVEALSGWDLDDSLIGDDRVLGDPDTTLDPGLPPPENTFDGDELTVEGVLRIKGLAGVLGLDEAALQAQLDAGTIAANLSVFESGNILIGGDGSDTIQGNNGNDIIDGDAWLNVRIGVMADVGGVLTEIGTTNYMQEAVQIYEDFQAQYGHLDNQALDDLVFARDINPSQLRIVREILQDDTQLTPQELGYDVDVAVFRGARAEYDVTENADGTWAVAHTRALPQGGAENDGTDTLRNIEVLRFADAIQIIGDVPNAAATGQLAITESEAATPARVGETFTATLGTVLDTDGLPPFPAGFLITWQVEETPGAGDWINIEDPLSDAPITGVSFTPTAAFELEGLRIRVIATFIDSHGIPEVVTSAPSVPLAAAVSPVATIGDDVLFGTVGNDIVDALAGDDEVFGFAGNDTLSGGPGSDILDGGDGTDTAVFLGALADFTFELTDTGTIEVIDSVTGEEDEVISIEQFAFDNATLTLAQVQSILAGGALPVVGTAGPDVLAGTAGADAIDSLGGADTIDGLGGNDIINGGAGSDTITGGNGVDTINGDGGDDELFGDGGADVLNGGAGLDTILGGAGADTISGGAGNDELFGDAGADVINGNGGADTIDGGAGADVLFGDAGIDSIDGGLGADTIDGGAGNDTLTGGGGVDMFVFTSGFGTDLITDFDDVGGGQDLIDLTAFGITVDDLTIANGVDGAEITSAATAGFGIIVVQNVLAANLGEDDFLF